MKTQPATFKRKTIIIKKGLQYRYMALIFFSVLAGFLLVGLEIAWNLSRILNEHPMYQPLLDEAGAIMPVFLIKTAIYLIIVLIVSSVISHKMAGPIYKFEKSASIVGSGDLTHRVYLRKDDHLVELQEEFNGMLGALQSHLKTDRANTQEVVKKLDDIASREQDVKIKGELLAASKQLAKTTEWFKL